MSKKTNKKKILRFFCFLLFSYNTITANFDTPENHAVIARIHEYIFTVTHIYLILLSDLVECKSYPGKVCFLFSVTVEINKWVFTLNKLKFRNVTFSKQNN